MATTKTKKSTTEAGVTGSGRVSSEVVKGRAISTLRSKAPARKPASSGKTVARKTSAVGARKKNVAIEKLTILDTRREGRTRGLETEFRLLARAARNLVRQLEDFAERAERADAEMVADIALLHAALAAEEETFPAELVNRLIDGEHPIKVYREYRGLSQAQLAKKVGTDRLYISQIETRKARGGRELLRKIARTLGVRVDSILED